MARAGRAVLALPVAVLMMTAGCATGSESPAVPSPSDASAGGPVAPAPPATSVAEPPSTAAPGITTPAGGGGSAPTLGLPWPVASRGYGEVRPRMIDNGGDPTGLVTDITWDSWGGATAVGHGTTSWVPPHAAIAQGRQERATVVAYRLGTCGGHPAYRAVQHFFPGHGEKFDPSAETFNACTGP